MYGLNGRRRRQGHDVGRIHEQLVSSTLNLRVQGDVLRADATRFKKTDFPQVGHAVRTDSRRVVADGHELLSGVRRSGCPRS